MRIFSGAQGYDPVDLLTYARGHLRAAEVLFGTDHHCFDSAGYVAHLGIELFIKAITLHAAGVFWEGHDLIKLLEKARAAGVSLATSATDEDTLYLLNRFQEGRYPTPDDPVAIGNADLRPIQQLWDHWLEQLPPQLRDAFRTRDPFQKGGRVLMVKGRDTATDRHREGRDAV